MDNNNNIINLGAADHLVEASPNEMLNDVHTDLEGKAYCYTSNINTPKNPPAVNNNIRCSPRLNNGSPLKILNDQNNGNVATKATNNVATPKKLPGTSHTIRCSPRLNDGSTIKFLFDQHQHNAVNNYQTTNEKLTVSVGMKFETSDNLESYLKRYAAENGFLFGKSFTNYKEEKEKGENMISNNKKKIVQFGQMYCRGKSKDVKCTYCIRFTNTKVGEYIITNGSCLSHTVHTMLNIEINGIENVQYEQQLTSEELQFMNELAQFSGDSMAHIRNRLQYKFPKRSYCDNLLFRIIKKFRDDFFGPGRELIMELMKLGEFHKNHGGAFEYLIDDTFRLKAFIIQTSAMRAYALKYNDFTILDGTHGTNKYGLILEPTTNVDCLGRSVITGIPICETENYSFSRSILHTLGLEKEGGTLMTDEGSAFFGLAENLGMIHVLCAYHFREKAAKVIGLGGTNRGIFLTKFNHLVFTDFDSEEKFNDYYQSLKTTIESQYSSECHAMKLIKSLYDNKEKVCVYYTKNIYTCGQTATSRGEGTNSRIKFRGDYKKQLAKFDLLSCVKHVLTIFEKQEHTSTLELAKYIEHGKQMTDYVHKILLKNFVQITQYRHVVLDENASTETMEAWSVYSTNGQMYSTVMLPTNTDFGYPTCTCGLYSSTLLPCPCICSVCSNRGWEPVQSKTLHPRWRQENHPLWRNAHLYNNIQPPISDDENFPITQSQETENEGMTQPQDIENVDMTQSQDETLIPRSVFNRIKFYGTENKRYAKLKERFDVVVKLAQKPATYKHLFAVLAREEVILSNYGLSEGNFNNIILAPLSKSARKHGRTSNDEVVNHFKKNRNSNGTKYQGTSYQLEIFTVAQ
jgi:hypothetical protein